ncbi:MULTISPECIES: bifunctional UDP-3-O-[3-hydroxymyristoyl] N-acetylglucosamine deacetylase/3-hydroxyacyl-ACP dehydratase [Sanguibacteroides]|mgnify:CR=1 FL=1|uniref:UDP-3-O-acyl-N-acetylglucosamine deacetylase n=1 Tax=Sanguibacteroides justesenii TaxID=1547597 RepID=A0A0C3RDK9_9PORP|nr:MULTISPECIES: bifunctional UDP-3-O-[3-hydroxymyristoyl] N-acetylglucosamine deacetylase/3-hydroxyacyl-ACP dehydratase [Sanguibacteroides]KIO42884.1 hydroxymyristoyl-ACP dehydratase [Sanguibacteroides justesenii]KIO46137.1 hydroxymyristoyl-ACP dehydratase [Sanguibacteroides justesenii]PXZ44205.1 bifunctional UDP-3-O-[3-hydroxymyristoyl] N-acetylglucosamine deacetylase/3-hydroxyacyl-ACP dehydratase [Sanguibacteroides justesenii]
MTVKQKTLKGEFSLSGKGLHTGKHVTVTFKPAKEDFGYKIHRIDLDGTPEIPALAEYVKFVDRASCLEKDGVYIYTMEHAMAALYGSGIDNCLIELDGEEFPILDGSSKMYTDEIAKIGLEEQAAERKYFVVKEQMEYVSEDGLTKLTLLPDKDYNVNLVVAYDSPYLKMQYATYSENNVDFAKDFAPCRTFVFLREIEMLLQHNLIKGGDLDNAIVIVDRKISQEEVDRLAKLFNYDSIEVKEGILNNLTLYFDNEPARHKLLDVIGDLALCGRFIKGRVIAERPGHKANAAMAQKIYKAILHAERGDVCPDVDVTSEPLMDINKVKSLLPHRPPFLLVDKIYEVTDDIVIGCKNVTMNEPFFVGHFPEEPVMPGVLIVEAMAQCGGILVLNQVEDPENYSTYFVKIDGIKFRRKVVPGDTLVFKLIKTAPIRRGIVTMKAYAFVGKNLVCEVAEFMAQVAKTKK